MEAKPADAERTPWQQAHIDIEVVAGRVTGLEANLSELKNQVGSMARDVQAGFANQANVTSLQMRDLGVEIKAQGAAFAASRQTNIASFLQTSATVAGVLGAFGWAFISPLIKEQDATAVALQAATATMATRHDADAYEAAQTSWTLRLAQRLQLDEDGAVTQRQLADLAKRVDDRYNDGATAVEKRLERDESVTTAIEAQQVKRPEIEAAARSMDQRIDALSARANTVQEQVDALFPPSKLIDELFAAVREIRSGVVALPK
jgi:hypothetical protein